MSISQPAQRLSDVLGLTDAFNQFFKNTFSSKANEAKQLLCLSSGQPAVNQVETDLLSYIGYGKEAAEKSMQDRLHLQKNKFHDPLIKQRLVF